MVEILLDFRGPQTKPPMRMQHIGQREPDKPSVRRSMAQLAAKVKEPRRARSHGPQIEPALDHMGVTVHVPLRIVRLEAVNHMPSFGQILA
jgi:hypothetical protein